MSVESRSPVVSRNAPTIPVATSATALLDTDSMQTDVAVMVGSSLEGSDVSHLGII